MNREQRRKARKNNFKVVDRQPVPNRRLGVVPEETVPDFSSVPTATICQSINLLIEELRSRGIAVYDFDNKDKVVHGIQIIKGNAYFMATKEVGTDEEV